MWIKRIISAFLLSSLFIYGNVYGSTDDSNIDVDAKSAVLMEAYSGKVVFEKDGNKSLPPASVTKVMTILLTYDAIADGAIKPDDIITVSEHAASMGGSQIFLEPGEEQTVQTMLKCVVVASANDAAVALAERVSGSEEAFVQDMNKKAKELGMNNTEFKNASGLDADGHVTSAYDIALMTRELITKYPQVLEYSKIWQDTITHVTKRGNEQFGLTNTNKMLKQYPYATGLKTGSTGAALFCLSATAEKDGLTFIATIMGSPTSKIRFSEAAKILDTGFANYGIIQGDPANAKKGDVIVYKGEKLTVEALVKDEVKVLTKKGAQGELTHEINLYESVNAPITKDMKLGEIIYKYADEEVGRSELIAGENIDKLGLPGTLLRLLGRWI